MMKKIMILFVLLSLGNNFMFAQGTTVLHYKTGQGTAVTYATGPEELKTENNSDFNLKRIGNPVFYASTPEGKPGGAILFTPTNGYYHSDKQVSDSSGDFTFEVWVKARLEEGKDLDAKHSFGIASIGNGKNGYHFVQRADKWMLLVAGVQLFDIGIVTFNSWTHLAIVSKDDQHTIWLNGEQKGSFKKAKSVSPGFTIGNLAKGNNQFNGEVYEVRFTAFEKGQFDVSKDFLLNYKKAKAQKRELKLARKNRIINSTQKGLGIVLNKKIPSINPKQDFLIDEITIASKLYILKEEDNSAASLTLTNGIISRSFYVSENVACTSYKNLRNNAEFIRAVKPEAKIKIGDRWIQIGGLTGQPEKSYLLDEWLPEMESNPNAWVLKNITTKLPESRYPWSLKHNAKKTPWPPKGLQLILHFIAPNSEIEYKNVAINVHYEMYDGMPSMAKWITVDNNSEKEIVIEKTTCEILAVNQDQLKRLHVESDFSFALVNGNPKGSALLHYAGEPKSYHAGKTTTKWSVDPEYNTWATHNQAEDGYLGYRHINLLTSRLPMGPSETVQAKNKFKSFVTFEILFDSDDEERNSLAHRRMYRKLAPQVTESLLTAAITSRDKKVLLNMIDQMAELGFERLDIHPWPGISHDNLKPEYVEFWKEIASYAADRDIIMGGYELVIASRGRGKEVDCIDPATDKPGSLFGQSVCIASKWSDDYFKNTFEFFDKTGFKSWNADGPYHGDACASKEHKYHTNLESSQWQQWKIQVDVLHELQRRGSYIPIPDWYFLNGQSSTGMGYREATANLTPQQQLLLGRQYIYDGTWHKTPTMGWMTLQLVGFYTNDPRVGLEPLNKNIQRYERGLLQHLGSGCSFTVRGNRLYDTEDTKDMVLKWTSWFKKYREVLTGDIIHLARPTGRDLDYMMHVNPYGNDKGMLVVFNPTNKKISKKIKVPMYYTGVHKKATFYLEGTKKLTSKIDREYNAFVEVALEPNGYTWILIKE